jgi:hypothetical protein
MIFSHTFCAYQIIAAWAVKCAYEEMRLSQACDEIEELRVLLRKQCEDAENLLNSNDTRRFIGMENTNIVKVLQNVIQYQALTEFFNFVTCL